jgi:hypothetical protein
VSDTRPSEDSELNGTPALVEHLRQILPEVLADRPVALAYLYGSAAREGATPLSDIDIAVVVPDVDRLPDRYEEEARLTERLVALGVSKSDVRIINDAPIMLKGKVVTEGILLYSVDEVLRIEFETLTRRLYFDYAPSARRMQDEYIHAVLHRPGRVRETGA